MAYNPNIHHRRSVRLQGYDYSQAGLYFITICCDRRLCRFGNIENGEMKLNEFGKIAFDAWTKTPQLRPNVALGEFVIMPNHIHGIIYLLHSPDVVGKGELHSPDVVGRGELHSPDVVGKGELHSPDNKMNELHSSDNNNGELHSSDVVGKGELHSPDVVGRGELHSPDVVGRGELHSPDVVGRGELHSSDVVGKGELHSSDNNNGELHSSDNNNGECNSPLRGPSQTIGAIVRGYKSSVTKQLGIMGFDEKLWQRNYYEHIIRNEQSYNNISNYIINNPAKWQEDKFYIR